MVADRRERDGPYPVVARGRSRRRGAGERRSDRADGDGPGRRPRDDSAARLGQAGADRPDNESDDVGASGDPGESGHTRGARRQAGRTRLGRARLRRGRLGPHGRAVGDRRGDRTYLGRRCQARRSAGAGDERADPRADRSRPLHLKSLLWQAGACDRGGARSARRRDRARLGADAGARAGRGQGRAGRDSGGNARRLRGGIAGRCRGHGGGRRRLAGRNRRPATS